jgi:N6-L-threonylcarbamoyladenine synthase
MIVLGIESSCDETAAAIVREDGSVLSDVVASQIAVHAPFGGVVPELASREHLRNIVPVIERAVSVLPGGFDDVDGIAVTAGPGLVGALLVGVQTGKAIAWAKHKPLVGVDHLTAHLLAVHLKRDAEGEPPVFPYVALLVSGGHTALYLVRSDADVQLLGQTRDDAAGEAYDKVAKLLGLGYPGGPVVDKLAHLGDPLSVPLPMPMRHKRSLEFSFSGLKTAVAQHVHKHGRPGNEAALADLCASFQHAVVTVLVQKSVEACRVVGVPRLVLGGGVAANRGLRAEALRQCTRRGIALHVPPFASCTDNAAMIAYAGALRLYRGERDGLDLNAYSRVKLPPPTKKRTSGAQSA